ncbi:hypothetical protein C9I92_21860 [Photobacterium ganghwense]|nr:NlpC/P60 family protein [Photobacterium ganghwense]PSU05435.1 hypothetical protein C9I92_21860 [Photobacterium ganghwense]
MTELYFGDLLTKPYLRGARGENGYYDCYGLLMELYRRMGVEAPNYKTPETPRQMASSAAVWKQSWEPVLSKAGYPTIKSCDPTDSNTYALVPYSTLLLRVAGEDCHTAMLLPKMQFIHTWQGSGMVVVDRLLSPVWRNKVVGVYQPCSTT